MSGTRTRSLASSFGERRRIAESAATINGAPEGFGPLGCTSPLVALLGPFYARGEGSNFVLGLHVAEKHTNARGFAHGGVLLTLADVALGYAAEGSVDPPTRLITARVSADFAGSTQLRDWVEARVDAQRVGERMAFANGYVHAGDWRIVPASAVFAHTDVSEAREGGR